MERRRFFSLPVRIALRFASQLNIEIAIYFGLRKGPESTYIDGLNPAKPFCFGDIRMTIDKSLKVKRGATRSRSVLTRVERIARLTEADRWKEGDSPLGLPKVRVRKLAMKKKKKKKEEEGADGKAAPATGGKAGGKAPAGGAKGGAKK